MLVRKTCIELYFIVFYSRTPRIQHILGRHHRLALLCPWQRPCHVTDLQLAGPSATGLGLTLLIENVVIANNTVVVADSTTSSAGGTRLGC